MESVVNYPEMLDPAFMSRFDITMTYRRNATVWWPFFGPGMEAALLTPPRPKTESSPMVYFRSSPESGRPRRRLREAKRGRRAI